MFFTLTGTFKKHNDYTTQNIFNLVEFYDPFRFGSEFYEICHMNSCAFFGLCRIINQSINTCSELGFSIDIQMLRGRRSLKSNVSLRSGQCILGHFANVALLNFVLSSFIYVAGVLRRIMLCAYRTPAAGRARQYLDIALMDGEECTCTSRTTRIYVCMAIDQYLPQELG